MIEENNRRQAKEIMIYESKTMNNSLFIYENKNGSRRDAVKCSTIDENLVQRQGRKRKSDICKSRCD